MPIQPFPALNGTDAATVAVDEMAWTPPPSGTVPSGQVACERAKLFAGTTNAVKTGCQLPHGALATPGAAGALPRLGRRQRLVVRRGGGRGCEPAAREPERDGHCACRAACHRVLLGRGCPARSRHPRPWAGSWTCAPGETPAASAQLVERQATFAVFRSTCGGGWGRGRGGCARRCSGGSCGPGGVVGVVGAVEAEVAQRVELGLDPVQPGGVVGRVGELDVVGLRPSRRPSSSLWAG